jgi:F0F1-type ATP synthase assembly protein I
VTARMKKTTLTIVALDVAAVALYVFALRWLMPLSGKWGGLVMVLSLILFAGFAMQSAILRRRLKEK